MSSPGLNWKTHGGDRQRLGPAGLLYGPAHLEAAPQVAPQGQFDYFLRRLFPLQPDGVDEDEGEEASTLRRDGVDGVLSATRHHLITRT